MCELLIIWKRNYAAPSQTKHENCSKFVSSGQVYLWRWRSGLRVSKFFVSYWKKKNLNLLDIEYITIRFIFRCMSIKYIPLLLVGNPPVVLLEPMLFVFIRLTCLVGENLHHLLFLSESRKDEDVLSDLKDSKSSFSSTTILIHSGRHG